MYRNFFTVIVWHKPSCLTLLPGTPPVPMVCRVGTPTFVPSALLLFRVGAKIGFRAPRGGAGLQACGKADRATGFSRWGHPSHRKAWGAPTSIVSKKIWWRKCGLWCTGSFWARRPGYFSSI